MLGRSVSTETRIDHAMDGPTIVVQIPGTQPLETAERWPGQGTTARPHGTSSGTGLLQRALIQNDEYAETMQENLAG